VFAPCPFPGEIAFSVGLGIRLNSPKIAPGVGHPQGYPSFSSNEIAIPGLERVVALAKRLALPRPIRAASRKKNARKNSSEPLVREIRADVDSTMGLKTTKRRVATETVDSGIETDWGRKFAVKSCRHISMKVIRARFTRLSYRTVATTGRMQ